MTTRRKRDEVYMDYLYDMVTPNTFYTAGQLIDMLHDYTPPGWIRKWGDKRPFLHKQMPNAFALTKWMRRDPLIMHRPGRTVKHQKQWCLLLIGPVQQGETHPAHEVNE